MRECSVPVYCCVCDRVLWWETRDPTMFRVEVCSDEECQRVYKAYNDFIESGGEDES